VYKHYLKILSWSRSSIGKAIDSLERIVRSWPTKEGFLDGLKKSAMTVAGATALVVISPCTPYMRVLPPVTTEEAQLLEEFHNNPQAIQKWIDQPTVKYRKDKEQFGGIYCDKDDKKCDVWISALAFLRSKKGDCDEVMPLSHYSLDEKGVGLFLSDEANDHGHFVYLYPGENGFYGVISISGSEAKLPTYKSVHEAALALKRSEHDYYQEVILPDEEEALLRSNENLKDSSRMGGKVYFKK